MLLTDRVPGEEFSWVRTTVTRIADGSSLAPTVLPVFSGESFTAPRGVAQYQALRSGEYGVLVELIRADESVLAERPVLVTVRGARGITVVIDRGCLGVRCPASGGDPSLSACLAGQCVDPRCSPELPEHCPPSLCEANADCAGGSACSDAQCTGGVCLEVEREGVCPARHWCNPETGCEPSRLVDGATDTGRPMVDAGTSDAGTVLDAGPPPPVVSPVPAGAIMAFNLATCPAGWVPFAGAEGRYVVGVAATGTLGATVGTALTDQENRAVGRHSHVVPGREGTYVTPATGFAHNTRSGGADFDTNLTGTVDGTNAPYVQLLYCQKE